MATFIVGVFVMSMVGVGVCLVCMVVGSMFVGGVLVVAITRQV